MNPHNTEELKQAAWQKLNKNTWTFDRDSLRHKRILQILTGEVELDMWSESQLKHYLASDKKTLENTVYFQNLIVCPVVKHRTLKKIRKTKYKKTKA